MRVYAIITKGKYISKEDNSESFTLTGDVSKAHDFKTREEAKEVRDFLESKHNLTNLIII